jgi:aspartate beta-hydroxylase
MEEYHLSRFAQAAVKRWVRLMGDPDNTHLSRIKDWLLLKINKKSRARPLNDWQKGCPDIVPGLRALPFWEVEMPEMQWLREVEASFADVRAELLQLRGQQGFQPYRQPAWSTKIASPDVGAVSHDKGDWNVFYLFLHNQRFEENCARCPKTCQLIERVAPRQYKHAFFSALQPGTHVIAHTGPTNKKLRCHMPIVGVEGSRLRVGSETREQEEGKVYVFDDS